MNNLISNLLSKPLAMHEMGARQIRSLPQVNAREIAEKPEWMTMDYMGNVIPEPYDFDNGTRVIPLFGAITRGLGLLGKYYGMADTDEFVEQVNAAANDPKVSSIILHIQSPGGDAIGCCEASEAVQRASVSKPVKAFTDEIMASAAYFIGAASEQIYVTKSALIGSIGTYVVLADDSKFWERMGVEYIVLRSGKYKGAGIDGYDDEQINEMQRMVDSFGLQFRNAVSAYRNGAVDLDDMQGQIFLGEESVEKNISDFVVDNLMQIVSDN